MHLLTTASKMHSCYPDLQIERVTKKETQYMGKQQVKTGEAGGTQQPYAPPRPHWSELPDASLTKRRVLSLTLAGLCLSLGAGCSSRTEQRAQASAEGSRNRTEAPKAAPMK